MVDGANARQRFWNVTIPHLRPTILLVVTLGVIGTWQVFDQMYIMGRGKPAKTNADARLLVLSGRLHQPEVGPRRRDGVPAFLLIFLMTQAQRWLLR